MRACVVEKKSLSALLSSEQAMSCGLTHRGRARLEQQLGLSLPFLHGVEVHHLCVYCECGCLLWFDPRSVTEHVLATLSPQNHSPN
jgi:hypothetical protein